MPPFSPNAAPWGVDTMRFFASRRPSFTGLNSRRNCVVMSERLLWYGSRRVYRGPSGRRPRASARRSPCDPGRQTIHHDVLDAEEPVRGLRAAGETVERRPPVERDEVHPSGGGQAARQSRGLVVGGGL